MKYLQEYTRRDLVNLKINTNMGQKYIMKVNFLVFIRFKENSHNRFIFSEWFKKVIGSEYKNLNTGWHCEKYVNSYFFIII